ncbi:hypothetical protein VCHA53O466_50487 [Vibrio chagasii]|nr:hypothetical protein VCHA53O466_50487 [Vibrio chagasii]
MTKQPSYLTKSLRNVNLDLMSIVHELRDSSFLPAGLDTEFTSLGTLTWVHFPKSSGVHGVCHIISSNETAIFIDARYKGEGMGNELRRLLAHELVHLWQYQNYLDTGKEEFLDLSSASAKGHGYYFHAAAEKLNAIDPSLSISSKHVGFDNDSSLESKSTVVVIHYEKESLQKGRETPHLKTVKSAYLAENLDSNKLLESISSKYGSAAIKLEILETLSPLSESLPLAGKYGEIPSGKTYIENRSSIVGGILNHESTEVIDTIKARGDSGSVMEFVVVELSDTNDVAIFHGDVGSINLNELILDLVPIYGSKINGVQHYSTGNLNVASSFKLTKAGGVRKNQVASYFIPRYAESLVSHNTTTPIRSHGRDFVYKCYIESMYEAGVISLNPANNSFDLRTHIKGHISSIPTLGNAFLFESEGSVITNIANKACGFLPQSIQERIVGVWASLDLTDEHESLSALKGILAEPELSLECYEDIREELDLIYCEVGAFRFINNDNFVAKVLLSAGVCPDDLEDLKSNLHWSFSRHQLIEQLSDELDIISESKGCDFGEFFTAEAKLKFALSDVELKSIRSECGDMNDFDKKLRTAASKLSQDKGGAQVVKCSNQLGFSF